MARKDGRFPFHRFVLVAAGIFAVVAVVFVVAVWPSVSAQYRAAVTLSAVIENPASPLVEGFTDEPSVSDEIVAGVPTLVARPGGEGPHPAIVFMNGAVPPGREEPTVGKLARGLARAGYVVYIPDVSGLRTGEISTETVSETVDVARSVADEPGTRDGRVAFVGVSVGASLALLAAADEALAPRVSVVSVVAPYTDLENVTRLATTDVYPGEDGAFRYETPPYLRLLTARSLAAMLPEGEERASLLTLIPEIRHYYPPADEADEPLAALPAFKIVREGNLDPETKAVLELLTNDAPERFGELYEDISPRMREEINTLSPATGASRIEAPVEIATAPRDRYFPVAESEALEGDVSELRLTVTAAMNHAEPEPSDIPAFLELNGFVVRSLELADARRESGAVR
ncbi:MAG: alpha/beta fold hydrolase [Actinomycetota bacterium]|jgi:pimeloyl-ACP methyl ester carboxylesterase|nr:alpha/beta fold hydrolase [Rubrobacter sp.]MDQ3508757.1 alpha/beta fold hydrolase [Actinomycetota bacterium]